jgi:hypothetical protein
VRGTVIKALKYPNYEMEFHMNQIKENSFLDQELAQLESTSAAFAQKFIPDAKVRRDYIEQTKRFSLELKDRVAKKTLQPQQAAQQAQTMRNTIMEAQRTKTTSLGLSMAQFMKKEGKTLAQLEAKYSKTLVTTQRNFQLFGKIRQLFAEQ